MFILLLSCSDRQEVVYSDLTRWDDELWNGIFTPNDTLPRIILDNLNIMDTEKMSAEEEALFCLLYTRALDMADYSFQSDSIINRSVELFKDKGNLFDYARALLYQGIVRYRIDVRDTSALSCFKEAEKIFKKSGKEDIRFCSLLYSYLGDYYLWTYDFKNAFEYLDRSDDREAYYLSLASGYHNMEKRDSALSYADSLFTKLAGTKEPERYKYYDFLADLFSDYGQDNRAKESSDSAYSSFRQYAEGVTAQKVSELEHKYDIAEKQYEIDRLRQFRIIWIISIVLSSIIAILSVTLYVRNLRQQKEKERSRNVINKLLLSICSIYPSFKKVMEHPVNQDEKQSFNDYKKSLKQIDSSLKKNISKIINEGLSGDTSFSEQERAVIFLLNEGFERKEISVILNISPDSVRTVISNIKAKNRR